MLKEHAMFMSLHPVNNSGVTGTGLCVGVRESWGDASIGYITTLMTQHFGVTVFTPQINQTNYFIVRLKVDQRAGQFSLPHLGITQTEKIELKHKNDEQISPVNGLEPWDQSYRQEQTKVGGIRFSEKVGFELKSETVKKWWR